MQEGGQLERVQHGARGKSGFTASQPLPHGMAHAGAPSPAHIALHTQAHLRSWGRVELAHKLGLQLVF